MTIERARGKTFGIAWFLPILIFFGASLLVMNPLPAVAQPQSIALNDRQSDRPTARADSEGWPPWLHALGKTTTYEAFASIDTFLLGSWWTGSQAIGGGFTAVSIATASLAYYLHERAWVRWGPDPNTASAEELGLYKMVTYRIVSAVRLMTMTYLLTGSLLISGAYVAANTVIDSVIFYGNDLAWAYYGPPVRKDGTAAFSSNDKGMER